MCSAPRQHHAGFTIVELLVATAILGILLSAIVALTSGFLGFSRRVSSINTQLADLNDVMGYVALDTRRAMRVVGATDVVRVDPPDGTAFDCTVATGCIALVVPVTDTATSAITSYTFVAYRVAPLSTWGGNPGIPAGWAGAATPALFQYTRPLACATGCPVPTVAGTTVDATRTSLVIPDLFMEDGAGAAVLPFEVTGGDSRITIRLRTRGVGQSGDIIVPSDQVLETFTLRRP